MRLYKVVVAMLMVGVVASESETGLSLNTNPRPEEVSNRVVGLPDSKAATINKGVKFFAGKDGAPGTDPVGCVFDQSKNSQANRDLYFFFNPGSFSIDTPLFPPGKLDNLKDRFSFSVAWDIDQYKRALFPEVYNFPPTSLPMNVIEKNISYTQGTASTPRQVKVGVDYFEANAKVTKAWNTLHANWKVPIVAKNSAFMQKVLDALIVEWAFENYIPRPSAQYFPVNKPIKHDFRDVLTNFRTDDFGTCTKKIEEISQNLIDQYLAVREAVLRQLADNRDSACTAKELNSIRALWGWSTDVKRFSGKFWKRIKKFRIAGATQVCSGLAAPKRFIDASGGTTYKNLDKYFKVVRTNPFHPYFWGLIDRLDPNASAFGYGFQKLKDLNGLKIPDANFYKAKANEPVSELNQYYVRGALK